MALEDNKIGLVHFMAYPGPGATMSTQRGEAPEQYLLDSVKAVIEDSYFSSIEITRIKNLRIRRQVSQMLGDSGMEVIFSAQPVQLINEDNIIAPTDISSSDDVQRRQAVMRIKECIDQAYDMGATKFGLVSGQDPGTSNGLDDRRRAVEALILSLDEICRYSKSVAADRGVEPLGITLEMFDRLPDRGCKNQLVGPAKEALDIAKTVRRFYGHEEFGLLYDLSHMLLIRDVSFDGEQPEVLKELAPYLVHVHVGNCVTDPEDELYGDNHPSFDYPAGAIDGELLARYVKALNEIGYSGSIGFEVMPHGSEISESVIEVTKSWFDRARRRLDVNYALGPYYFQARRFLTEDIFDMITDTRVCSSGVIQEVARARVRRDELTRDGKLVILAADHPARYVTSVGSEPVRMGDRMEYLGRIARVLMCSEIDGVMGTPDIIDDLFILEYLLKDRGEEGFLDERVILGCMNRSGLAGVEYEMDDKMTAFTADRIEALGLDGAKMMFRIDPGSYSRYSIRTLEYCANAINDCGSRGIPVFLEPLPVRKNGDSYQVVMEADALIKAIGVGSALGESSADLWLKIPYVPEYYRVLRATTLPVLMLGGSAEGDPTGTIENFARGLAEGGNCRGALVGRNVLYPGIDDPAAVANAINEVVHRGVGAETAIRDLAASRGKDMGFLRNLLM